VEVPLVRRRGDRGAANLGRGQSSGFDS
jgi:hypothetical protein